MKFNKLFILLALCVAASACDKNKIEDDPYLTVSYASVAGNWQLTRLDGVELPDGVYAYMVLGRRRVENENDENWRAFEMYDNMNGMQARKHTGFFVIEKDADDFHYIDGWYDNAYEYWRRQGYFIRHLLEDSMSWVARDGSGVVYLYERVDAIPDDVVSAATRVSEAAVGSGKVSAGGIAGEVLSEISAE